VLQESPAVEVKNLRKEFLAEGLSFARRASGVALQNLKVYHQLVAVDDISFVMHRGEAFGFLGPNGAGKSTIVKIITGLVKPTSGTVRVLGRPLNDMEMRRSVGYLPELPNFHRWLRTQEFLEFHGRLYGLHGAALAKRCAEALALVGLEGREQQKLGAFSKGMLQRIGLAQALLNRPELIILDEPVSGLDPVGQSDMRNILLRLKAEGTSVFLNSHQLVDVEMICDRVAIINRGKLLKIGPPQSLFDEPLTVELHVDRVRDELLHHLGSLSLAVRQVEDKPSHLLVEVQNEEQAADIAAGVHSCGARLYMMIPHGRSLEDLFLRTIGALRHDQ
jgi:ABC-2 type transport system ATP-binding protein